MEFLTKTKLSWTFVFGLLILICLALLHKSLLHGAGWNHSYFFNSVWIMEFDDALHRGVFPPRWLFGGNNGLGSPSFYFYPPAPFYVTAIIAFFSPEKNDYAQITAWGGFYMTLASGMTMYIWLRRQAGDILALVGAALYILAPYHQVDYFVRGSMGETMAYVALPLVMLCLQGTARATSAAAARPWIAGLALSYGALFYCHLIMVLLVTVSILPVYALYLLFETPKEQRWTMLIRCMAGGLLGGLIAASYVGPATFLQKYASLQWMFSSNVYQPRYWAMLSSAWPNPGFGLSMTYLGYASGAGALAAVLAVAERRVTGPAREALVWGVAGLFSVTLYAIPWIWQAPMLNKVQFAFRILVALEFAAVTAVIMAAAAGRWLRLLVLLPLCLFPLKRGFVDLQGDAVRMNEASNGDISEEVRGRIANRRTPDEHLPAGFDISSKLFAVDGPTLSGFNAVPAARAEAPEARITPAGEFKDGSFAIAVDTPRPTRIILRRFYFPTWEIALVQKGRDPIMADAPFGPERLLSFTAEPGRHTYRVRIIRSTLEKICDAISILALLSAFALLAPSASGVAKTVAARLRGGEGPEGGVQSLRHSLFGLRSGLRAREGDGRANASSDPYSGARLRLVTILSVLALAGLFLAGPFLEQGVGPSDSVIYNTVWVKEFIAALLRGELPPRWLPGAFQGLGAPSFDYYPPLAFYVAAVADFFTLHKLNALQVTAWANLMLLLSSGGGMFAWLRGRTGDRWALIGAVAYMLAPYHTIDFYFRGAFAEVTAYAVLPWFLLGLERAASSPRGIAGLALGYAALILAHLPSALLVTVIVIPAVVSWRLWTAAPTERIAIAARCLAGGALGLALATVYLGPALLMQKDAQMGWLWGGDTDAWSLLSVHRWPAGDFMKKVALTSWCAGAAGLAALLAAIDAPRRRTAAPAMLFGAVAVAATVLHALPWVWKFQPLSQVQFAYRIIVVTEVSAVAAVCLAAVSGRPRRLAALMIAPAVLAGWALVLSWPGIRAVTTTPVDPGAQALIAAGRAPNEHLPADYYPYPAFEDPNLLNGFPGVPLVALGEAGGKVLAASGFPDGSVAMDLDLPTATTVVVKRFYFPSWRAERVDGRRKITLKAQASGTPRFVSFQAAAGRHVYRIRQVPTLIERASTVVTFVALLVVAGLLIVPAVLRRRRFRQEKSEAAIGTR